MEKKNSNSLGWLLFIVTAVFSVTYFLISNYHIDGLRKDIEQKDEIIQDYTRLVSEPKMVSDRNGNKISVDSLVKENANLINDISEYKTRLDLIERNYDIHVENKNGLYKVKADKVDSALLLLNMFRDAISYDPRTRNWVVTRVK
jgi:hypothetical protein